MSIHEIPSLGFYVPNHLQPFPKAFKRRRVNISSLYVGVKNKKGQIKYTSIKESIIYKYLHDKLVKGFTSSSNISAYRNYIQENAVTQEAELLSLVNSIKNNGIQKEYPPLIFRSIKRIVPLGRYDVADGHNRLCVMAIIGHQKIDAIYFKRNNMPWAFKRSQG